MHRRTVRTTALMLAGVMAALLVPVLGLATPASAAPEPYELTMTEGELSLNGSEEPAALETPTTISGTNDGGTLTAGTLSTPTLSFTQHITSPADTDVFIDAAFSQVTAGNLTGNVDPNGDVTVTTQLRVDLDIEVEILPGQHFSCSTLPVNLTLEGNHDGDSVVLTDEDFTVPPTGITPTCPDFVAAGIDNQLAGSGHSIELAMTGPLTRAIDPGDPSVTTLEVSTAGPVEQGDEVTLTATVAAGPDAEETSVPTGSVTFLDGSHVLGNVPLDGAGTAALATTDILAGNRQLRARYEGSAPLYAPSTSAPVALQVIAHPIVDVELPPALQVGTSADFPVEATNTGLGRPITNARLDVTIQRASGSSIIFNGANQRLRGSIAPAAGVPLAPGESLSALLRVGPLSNLAVVGGLRVTVTLVEVDAGGVVTDTVAEGSDDMELVSANRVETTISAGQAAIPDFGIPETPPVLPAVVRAGNVATLSFFEIGPQSAGPLTGVVTFSVGGRVLEVRHRSDGSAMGWRTSILPTEQPEILVPWDLGAGPHTLTVSYAGDARYRPVTASFPFDVAGPIGPSYECRAEGTVTGRFRAQLEARATLPTAAVPGTVGVDNLSMRLHFSRATRSLSPLFTEIPGNPDKEIALAFGPEGTGQAAEITEVNNTEMTANDGSPIDHSVILQSATGEATIDGEPGETVPVTVDSMTFTYIETFQGAQNTVTCTPVGDAFVLGTVTVAGTTLAASPASYVGSGNDVTLHAATFPGGPGTVEFRDGGTTIGVVPTTNGSATFITSDLPAGTAEITAIFRGALHPTTTSNVVSLVVVADCPDAVEPGNGATVRLAYIELLRRCPDNSGYLYWKGQLDAEAVSPEVFAQRISNSREARMIIVDDAYELMLERAPEPDGRAFWADRLGRNARYDDLVAELGASPEFRALAGGTDQGVVTRVYERIAQRSPDADGLAFWRDYLAARGVRRLVKAFFNSPEPLGRVVTASYQEILERDPDAEELTAGSGMLKDDSDRSALYASIIGTDEFETRAQEFPGLS